MNKKRKKLIFTLGIIFILLYHMGASVTEDQYTHDSPHNYLTDFTPTNEDGSINVVVEIPTGTTAKWEVTKPDGKLEWEFKDGVPREVKYLGYPGNYGMIPGTLLPEETGGDRDPLDVIVLGPAIERGEVIEAKLIGVLKLLDDGEQDDKLIAALKDTPFFEMNSIEDLNKNFNGTTTIIETWFENYKGPGEIESLGFGEKEEAMEILKTAISALKE